MEEVWKPIGIINGVDFAGLYEASTLGDIKSLRKDIIIKPSNVKGYLQVKLSQGENEYNLYIHRIVATVFGDNPENKPCVNHIDGNKANNCTDNLEWVTRSENTLHAFRTGLKSHVGEKHSRSVLTDFQVRIIKRLLGCMKQNHIARYFDVSRDVIYSISSGKTWRHINVD